MKKVLIVNWRWFNTGGDWTYLQELVNFYQDEGYKVYGLTTNNGQNITLPGVELFTVKGLLQSDNKGFNILYYPFKLVKQNDVNSVLLNQLRRIGFSLVHVNSIQNSVGSRFIFKLDKNIPVLYTLHDYHLTCPAIKHIDSNDSLCLNCVKGDVLSVINKKCRENNRLKSFAAAFSFVRSSTTSLFERVNVFICPSEFVKSLHILRGIQASKLIVVNNPVNVEKNKDVNSKTNKRSFLYIGRYEKIKGIMTLLEAMKDIKGATLYLYGKGPMEDNINRYIEENDLINYVHNMGFVNRSEVPSLLSNHDAVVIPSEWYENYPYSLSESLAKGVPVIGSNIGGIPEMINHGYNGLMFAMGDVDDLKEKLNSFIEKGVQLSREEIIHDADKVRNIGLWKSKMRTILAGLV